ncbi:MAG: phosphatase PAP2 family protein [Candidatus Methylomirabilota bacterium]|jgi:undecaprenyl-diphosphatase
MAGLLALDASIFHLINRSLQNPLLDLVMPILSNKRYFLLPALVVVLMLLVWGGRRMWVVVAVALAALVLSDLGTNLIKAALHRTRPCHVIPDIHLLAGCTRSFSLPSNHASNMFALATVGWLGFRRWRWALVLLAVGVAYSRVYLGVHYPADVLVGALWGGALGWGLTTLAAHLWPGWFDTPAAPPPKVPADSSS